MHTLSMRFPIAKLPEVTLAIGHAHFSDPMRSVVIDRSYIDHPIFEAD